MKIGGIIGRLPIGVQLWLCQFRLDSIREDLEYLRFDLPELIAGEISRKQSELAYENAQRDLILAQVESAPLDPPRFLQWPSLLTLATTLALIAIGFAIAWGQGWLRA